MVKKRVGGLAWLRKQVEDADKDLRCEMVEGAVETLLSADDGALTKRLVRAQSEGARRVKLEVEDINPLAKRLYERVGFSEDKFERLTWPRRIRFRFFGSCRMSEDLALSEP